MPQEPVLLKPRDVSNLPAQRVHDRQSRTDHLLVVEIRSQFQRSPPRVLQRAHIFVFRYDGSHLVKSCRMIATRMRVLATLTTPTSILTDRKSTRLNSSPHSF